uniref:F-box domain-containing protein n=1 Tax=Bionectria ochroleuca TaxID=29856 RepID=A0A8H7N0L0_BIOOC
MSEGNNENSDNGESENNESENSWSDGDYERYELEALAKIPTMPQEVQDLIFSFCDLHSRFALCALNKEWNAKITPLLWAELDFANEFEDEDLVERTRKFFAACDTMIDESPERFAALASYVQTLNVGRLHGVNIVHEEFDGDGYIFFDGDGGDRCVFDVIARFANLQSLSVYVKSWWESPNLAASGRALARGLTKLTSLKLGGQMSTDVLLGLLNNPEQLKDLTLINLIETPGQDYGPDGIAFLSGISHRFTSLETLHLCKLADLDGRLSDDEDNNDDDDNDREYASGMRWRFPRESEVSVLEDWASLLRNTSTTLQSLTLENRYLCSYKIDRRHGSVIDPGNTHPAEYGAFSIRESQRALFPELSNRRWPRLSNLKLIGMGTVEDVNLAVSHLEPRVHVEQRPAYIENMGGDATPEEISTPIEFTYRLSHEYITYL